MGSELVSVLCFGEVYRKSKAQIVKPLVQARRVGRTWRSRTAESDLKGGKDGQMKLHLACLDGQTRYKPYLEVFVKTLDAQIARESKVIVALAFRNKPIEDVHAGKLCSACCGSPDYSRITEDEMKAMMKSAVNAVYKLLWNRDHDPEAYRKSIEYGVRFTSRWDEAE
jgi:hypothetical protein